MIIITNHVPPFTPLGNITPFTYRDGETYVAMFKRMRDFVNHELIDVLNTNLGGIDTGMQETIDEVNAALDAQVNVVNDALAEQVTAVNEVMAEINTIVAAVNAALASAQTAANNSATSATASDTARAAAVTAKTAAETAAGNSATSATASDTARAAAVTAKNSSETAAGNAATSATASDTARAASVTAKDASVVAKDASVAAKTASEAARDSIIAVYGAAPYSWANAAARAAQTGMVAGSLGRQVDVDMVFRYNGTAWKVWNVSPRTFNPAIANFVSAGAGTVETGEYRVINGIARVKGSATLSATAPVTVGSARVTLPVDAEFSVIEAIISTVTLKDVSPIADQIGMARLLNATTVTFHPLTNVFQNNIALAATVPFTWAISDIIRYEFEYTAN